MTRGTARRFTALVWRGGPGASLGGMLTVGAAVWAGYSLLHLALHGPVLDEVVPAAQVIAGAVHYPTGHPSAVFYRHVFGLSYNLGAAVWHATRSVAVISGFRNFEFLALSTFVPYAVAVVLTRRPMWGHVAAALTVSETACSFVGVYLSWVFPGYYSSGHIGIHLSVLIATLLVAGFWRWGGLLLGLLPAFHVAMALLVWPWAALQLLAARLRAAERRRVLAGLAAGLAVCAVLGLVVWLRTRGDAPAAPYDATADAEVIRRAFIATTDPHRQPIRLLSAGYLVSPVALAALGALALARRETRRAAGWLLFLGAIVWSVVFGTRAYQGVTGGLPAVVETLMPGRYANLAGVFLLPFTVVALAAVADGAAPAVGVVVAALCAAILAGQMVLTLVDRPLVFRYLVDVVWGFVFAADAFAHRRDGRRGAVPVVGLVAVAAAMLALGSSSLVSLATLLGSAAATVAVLRAAVPRVAGPRVERTRRRADALLAGAVVLAAASALPGLSVMSGWDAGSERISPFERQLDGWLATNAAPDDLLLTPIWPPTLLQAKTGHPVFADFITLLTMTYMSQLAPPTGAMVRDVYGVDYAHPETLAPLLGPDGLLRPTSPTWLAAWESRSCVEWQRLRDVYAFRFVLAPAGTPLHLPVVLAGDRWKVHAVPPAGACGDGGS